MPIYFSIRFNTEQGQHVFLDLFDPDNTKNCSTLQMDTSDGCLWTKAVPREGRDILVYRYHVKSADGYAFYEAGAPRTVRTGEQAGILRIADEWQGNDSMAPFLSAAFTGVFFNAGAGKTTVAGLYGKEVIIKVTVPAVGKNKGIYICGNIPELGCWDTEKAPPMSPVEGAGWEIRLHAGNTAMDIYYKFLIKDHADGSLIWESGPDRHLEIPYSECSGTYIAGHSSAALPLPHPHFHGTAVPVFSLRTEDSCGIGEFSDLKKLADWASATGQSIIQILPVNDTSFTGTWEDSYPYSAVSVMALHPIYANIRQIDSFSEETDREEYENGRKELEGTGSLDYEKVARFKAGWLKRLYDRDSGRTLESGGFKAFLKENGDWLLPYASFCVENNTSGQNADAGFYCFVQYHLHMQFLDAKEYLHSKGIALKGDIPIGVSGKSVETALYPHLFNMGMQAGAPPDDFAEDGQNWGFPVYEWERMSADSYSWWKRRLRKMAEYFDAFRIDHVLGFFRIWEIPRGCPNGQMGHFTPSLPMGEDEIREYGFPFDRHRDAAGKIPDGTGKLFVEDDRSADMFHPCISAKNTDAYKSLTGTDRAAFDKIYQDYFHNRNEELWRRTGLWRLPEIIGATDMLPCAEDLGMIPSCVPDVLSRLHILSLEVARMPKGQGETVGNPEHYPYLSVCTTGTHDMETLRGMYWKAYPDDMEHVLEECRKTVEKHARSSSMLIILPIQDWLTLDSTLPAGRPEDERINIPSDPDHRWRYRIPVRIEELIQNDKLNSKILTLTEHHGNQEN